MPPALRKKLNKRQATEDLKGESAEMNSDSDKSIDGVPRLVKDDDRSKLDLSSTPPPPPSKGRALKPGEKSPVRKSPSTKVLNKYKARSAEGVVPSVKPAALDKGKGKATSFTEDFSSNEPTAVGSDIEVPGGEGKGGLWNFSRWYVSNKSAAVALEAANPTDEQAHEVFTEEGVNFDMIKPKSDDRARSKSPLKVSKSAEPVRSLPWDEEEDTHRRRSTRSAARRQERAASPPEPDTATAFLNKDLDKPHGLTVRKKHDNTDLKRNVSPQTDGAASSSPDPLTVSPLSLEEPDTSHLTASPIPNITTYSPTPPSQSQEFRGTTSAVPVIPPLYNPHVDKTWVWTSQLASCSRPDKPGGWSKRWTCCQCRAETIVEQKTCAKLSCGHRKCQGCTIRAGG